jgi:hypothetical protein
MACVTIMVLQSPVSTKNTEKQAGREVLRQKVRENGEQRKICILAVSKDKKACGISHE